MVSELIRDKIFILDGAMGTVLQQRGLPPGGQPELLTLTDPELMKEIYRSYIAAGIQVVYANTFGASRRKLSATGHSVAEVVTAAVKQAKEAAEFYVSVFPDSRIVGEHTVHTADHPSGIPVGGVLAVFAQLVGDLEVGFDAAHIVVPRQPQHLHTLDRETGADGGPHWRPDLRRERLGG